MLEFFNFVKIIVIYIYSYFHKKKKKTNHYRRLSAKKLSLLIFYELLGYFQSSSQVWLSFLNSHRSRNYTFLAMENIKIASCHSTNSIANAPVTEANLKNKWMEYKIFICKKLDKNLWSTEKKIKLLPARDLENKI